MAPADNQASVSPLSARPVRDVGDFGLAGAGLDWYDRSAVPFGSQLPFRAPRRLLLKPGVSLGIGGLLRVGGTLCPSAVDLSVSSVDRYYWRASKRLLDEGKT